MIVDYPTLFSHQIFVIPVGHYFKAPAERCMMVYSPLANLFFLALPNEVANLEADLLSGKDNSILNSLLKQKTPEQITPYKRSYNAAGTLYLILNEKCNFHCKYCYSAGGRSNQEMNIRQTSAVLDSFLTANPEAPQKRTIMFIGGGEPTLSWTLVKHATAIAEEKAQSAGLTLSLRLSTNGSILTEEMISFYKEHHFNLQFSYDVLPDVQNEQRGQWSQVDKNLKRLLVEGIPCLIRSTITQACVNRMEEMVEFCHKNYPSIVGLVCEPVVDASFFTDKTIVDSYFGSYEQSYLKAARLAKNYGFSLMSSTYGSIRMIRERFCFNLICVTPYGTLTTCPSVSAPHEAGYENAVFAHIHEASDESGGFLSFDDKAYDQITSGSIHSIDACKKCWARWNCGSGCPSQRQVYSKEIFEAICDHTRRMLLDTLMEELTVRHNKHTGRDLIADITDKIKEQ